jgi:hypothetical protein
MTYCHCVCNEATLSWCVIDNSPIIFEWWIFFISLAEHLQEKKANLNRICQLEYTKLPLVCMCQNELHLENPKPSMLNVVF